MHNPFSLEGKRILVTGASSGIGRSTAAECSRLGAKLVLVARREDELQRTLESLDGDGHSLHPFDLQLGEAVVPWIKSVAAQTGSLDGLVHCAGVSITMPIRNTNEALYRKVFSINVDASYWLIKGFRQRGVHASDSSVVLLASVSGVVGTAGLSAYCASKGAVLSLAKSTALELAAERIRVNVISPAWVETEMVAAAFATLPDDNKTLILRDHPLGIGRPEDVGYAAIYLLSDAARWVTGANFAIDGGYTAR